MAHLRLLNILPFKFLFFVATASASELEANLDGSPPGPESESASQVQQSEQSEASATLQHQLSVPIQQQISKLQAQFPLVHHVKKEFLHLAVSYDRLQFANEYLECAMAIQKRAFSDIVREVLHEKERFFDFSVRADWTGHARKVREGMKGQGENYQSSGSSSSEISNTENSNSGKLATVQKEASTSTKSESESKLKKTSSTTTKSTKDSDPESEESEKEGGGPEDSPKGKESKPGGKDSDLEKKSDSEEKRKSSSVKTESNLSPDALSFFQNQLEKFSTIGDTSTSITKILALSDSEESDSEEDSSSLLQLDQAFSVLEELSDKLKLDQKNGSRPGSHRGQSRYPV